MNIKEKINSFFNSNYYLYVLGIITVIHTFTDYVSPILILFFAISINIYLFCDDISPLFPAMMMAIFGLSKTAVLDSSNVPCINLSNFEIIILSIMGALSLICLFSFMIKQYKNGKKLTKGKMFWGIFCVIVVTMLCGCGVPNFKLYYAFMSFCVFSIVYLIYFLYINYAGENKRKYLCKTFLFMGLVLTAEIFAHYLFAENPISALYNKSMQPNFLNINQTATYIAFCLPVALYMAISNKRDILYISLFFVMAIGLVITFSRGALLFALIFIPIVYVLGLWKTKRKMTYWMTLIVWLFVLLICLFALSLLGINIFSFFSRVGFDDHGRFDIWEIAIKLFSEHMYFGVGLFSYSGELINYYNTSYIWLFHSTPIQILVSFGLVGVLGYTIFYFEKYRTILSKFSLFKFFILMSVLLVEAYGIIDATTVSVVLQCLTFLLIAGAEKETPSEREPFGFTKKQQLKGLELKNYEMEFGEKRQKGLYELLFKRVIDIIGSIILLIILSPMMIITAIIVRIKIGKPVIFGQYRPGKNKKLFKLYKFRSMTNERDENGQLLPDEKRITKCGKLIRKLSLDELPQLINILKGEMSFIGPRPRLVKDFIFYDKNVLDIYCVRPGLSGPAQVYDRRSEGSWESIFEMDNKYVSNVTFFNDVKYILLTCGAIFKGGSSSGAIDNKNNFTTQRDYYYCDYLINNNLITSAQYEMGIKLANSIIDKDGKIEYNEELHNK